jgi:hypothetical protein
MAYTPRQSEWLDQKTTRGINLDATVTVWVTCPDTGRDEREPDCKVIRIRRHRTTGAIRVLVEDTDGVRFAVSPEKIEIR